MQACEARTAAGFGGREIETGYQRRFCRMLSTEFGAQSLFGEICIQNENGDGPLVAESGRCMLRCVASDRRHGLQTTHDHASGSAVYRQRSPICL